MSRLPRQGHYDRKVQNHQLCNIGSLKHIGGDKPMNELF